MALHNARSRSPLTPGTANCQGHLLAWQTGSAGCKFAFLKTAYALWHVNHVKD